MLNRCQKGYKKVEMLSKFVKGKPTSLPKLRVFQKKSNFLAHNWANLTQFQIDFQCMFCIFIFCIKNTMEWWNFYFLTFFLFFDDLYVSMKILIVWIYNAILTNFFEVGSKASNVGGSLNSLLVSTTKSSSYNGRLLT